MHLFIDPEGLIQCLYSEEIDLKALGDVSIRRASYVEPDDNRYSWADLAPVSGPQLGPFVLRSEALAAEQKWLERHWLAPADQASA